MIEVTLILSTEQIEAIARKMVEISQENDPKKQTEAEAKEIFLKISEVAQILVVSEQTVRRQIKAGFIKPSKIGGSLRISNKELERYARTS